MKQLLTILLLAIVFLQTFSRFVVEADYFLNKTFIATVLCVNKEKPEMQCHGKCYLNKQLKEQQKQEQQTPVSKKKLDNNLFNYSEFAQQGSLLNSIAVEYLIFDEPLLSSFAPTVFHPPTV